MERKMQSGKKILSAFLFILLISTLPSVAKAVEIRWSPEAPLTTDPAMDESPCVKQIIQATNNTEIWVVWSSNRTGNYDIFCNISSDGGATWSNYMQLTDYPYMDDHPSIMQTANGSIWLVWTREIMTPDYNWDIYHKISHDGGVTWTNDTELITDPDFDACPSIIQTANGTIWIVWHSDRIKAPPTPIPQDDIFYKTSLDGGVTWSNDMQLTEDIEDDVDPSIIQTSDSKIWVTWASNRYDGRDIFYKTYNGTTWSDVFQLTEYTGNDWAPSITQTTNGTIWVAWHSLRDDNYDIYYRTSDDGGASWSNDTRRTTDARADVTPSIMQAANGSIWFVWTRDLDIATPDYEWDIWYTTVTWVVHDVAVTLVTPNATAVFRGETVLIEVWIANEGNGSETFNITVYADENETVIGDEITIGTKTATNLAPYNSAILTFNWKTKNVSSGNYTISAYAWPVQYETDLTDNSLTNGVIHIIRLLGDLDYDGDVDQEDWFLFIGSYGSSIGDPNYNPDADLDDDGDVDDVDYMLFLDLLYPPTPSSAIEWPAIYITPSPIIETALTPTKNFTITIETDYNGSDIWSWELTLTYNPLVLEGVEVFNGNLTINQTYPATFSAGTFDNDAGKLSLTGGYFNVTLGEAVNVTSGPGILANVTFRVVGTGDTPITLGTETKLIGYDGADVYDIVDALLMPYNIGHGYFRNTDYDVVHDVAVLSGAVNDTSFYEGRTVSINVTVKNEGNVNESLAVSVYWRFKTPDWLVYNTTVTLDSAVTQQFINVVWNATGWFPGTGNLTVVVTKVWNETDTADNEYVIDAVHIRILGDVDEDGDVDGTDYFALVGPYPDLTPPPANPECDLDNDGDIDGDDWAILVGNLGKSE